jgi:hypothetical protein
VVASIALQTLASIGLKQSDGVLSKNIAHEFIRGKNQFTSPRLSPQEREKESQKCPKTRSPSIKRGLGGVLHFY